MKKYLLALSVFSCLANASSPTAELTVVGKITVPTCTVSAADNGVYSIGQVSPSILSPTASTPLPEITKTWTVTCDSSTYMNFTPTDNRSGTASIANANNFGLGSVKETGKIGYYTVVAKEATVDGTATRVFTSANASVSALLSVPLTPGSRTGWATGNGTTSTQAAGKVFTVDLAVIPVLASTALMGGGVTDDVTIDGSATLKFAYGI